MAENKTKPTKVSVASFLGTIADESRRADARVLVKLMQAATGEKPKMWGPTIVGFGSCHYVYDSGREGDMPLVAFSPRKPATVLYVSRGFPGFEALLARLGKHTTSGGCVYVKRLADLDQKVLKDIVVNSVAATRAKYRS
jgi:hypothetical protein